MHHSQTPSKFILLPLLFCILLIPLPSTPAQGVAPISNITTIPGYSCYRTVAETYAAAENLASNHPSLAAWIDIGDSWERSTPGGLEGSDIMVLKLTNQFFMTEKPKILILSGMHSDDLAPVELNLRFAEYLLANYGADADITWILDQNEVHLVLIANPDGRSLVDQGYDWHKNTNQAYCPANPNFRGADLNHNFPFHWWDSGDQCTPEYSGPAALSEPETAAIAAYIQDLFLDQRGEGEEDPAPVDATGILINLHSYGSYVLWPYGFTSSPAPNNASLRTLGTKLAFFNNYNPQQAIEFFINPHTGSASDFSYGIKGIASFTFMLGSVANENCTHFINTVLPDNLQALLYATKTARTPYLSGSGPDALNLTLSANFIDPGQSVRLTAQINGQRYQNNSEYTQNIQAAEYAIDLPFWDENAAPQPMPSLDGNFDSQIEGVRVRVQTEGLSSGRHILYVRGQDADGTWGAVSAVYLYINYLNYLPLIFK